MSPAERIAAEQQCLDALELVAAGNIARAYDLVSAIAPDQEKRLHRDFVLLIAAIKDCYSLRGGNYNDAVRNILRNLGELEQSRFNNRISWLHSKLGFALGVLGDPERGLEWTQRALVRLDNEPDAASEFSCLGNHGSQLAMLEQYEESTATLQRALDSVTDDQPHNKYVGLNNIAYSHLLWSRHATEPEVQQEMAQRALHFAEQALACAAKSHNDKTGLGAYSVYCNALLRLERFDDAATALKTAMQASLEHPAINVEFYIGAAQVEQSRKNWPGAREWLDKAESLARKHGLDQLLQPVFEARIRCEELADQPYEALRYAKAFADFQGAHYKQRLKAVVHSAEIFADAERSRWEALELRKQSKLMEEKMVALDRQRSLGQMSATLGHEINQPLTAIQTSAQALLRSFEMPGFDTGKQVKMAERVVVNTRRAAEIITKIRNFIKPAVAVNETVQVARLVGDVVELLRHDAMIQGVHVEVEQVTEPGAVLGDAIQLSQVLVNVARNAFEAMGQADERVLTIRMDATPTNVLLTLSDTGPGFSAATIAEAGTPFFTSKSTGLGIGLSISRDILKLHNGTLTLGNCASGTGAQIEIRLPRT